MCNKLLCNSVGFVAAYLMLACLMGCGNTSPDNENIPAQGGSAGQTGNDAGGDAGSGGQDATTDADAQPDVLPDVEPDVQAAGSWKSMSEVNAPLARDTHTAVWTGSKMIVWGGRQRSATTTFLATGGIYDLASDTWQSLSQTNAPQPRIFHTAVWTGSKMIVWGGSNDSSMADQSIYNPSTDEWSAMSTTNAPTPRFHHTAVWTGSKMIVWGGVLWGGDTTKTGGIYDPSTDVWGAVTDAPQACAGHTAVWTGSKMIVWGGVPDIHQDNVYCNSFAYDPGDDVWTMISSTDAPTSRTTPTAIWTGSKMIVWGGNLINASIIPLNTGGIYDPSTDVWGAVNKTDAPTPRFQHSAIWTGSKMIVWGGQGQGFFNTGALHDPALDSWQPMTQSPLSSRTFHSAIWTGSKMIVWGGFEKTVEADAQVEQSTASGGTFTP